MKLKKYLIIEIKYLLMAHYTSKHNIATFKTLKNDQFERKKT